MAERSPSDHLFKPWVPLRQIRSEDLTVTDLPADDAEWRDVLQFALTFNLHDCWGSFERCAEIALNPDLSSLNEIRTSLYFQQRAWNQSGIRPPSEENIKHWLELVAAMRRLINERHHVDDVAKL